ncbi:MAG: hypothetical protein ABIO76_01805, partial [Ginsengibacter sp.]
MTLFSYSIDCLAQSNGFAKKGVLDLSKWDWKTNGIVDLNGEWEFYWNTLYDPTNSDTALNIKLDYVYVPGFWNAHVPGAGM